MNHRILDTDSENRNVVGRVLFATATAGTLIAALALFLFDPTRVPIFPVCAFHRFTGLNCPACGSLRAIHALMHGHWLDALHFNAFLVLSLPLFAWLGFRFVRLEMRRDPAPLLRTRWMWIYLGLWMVFGIARELPIPFLAVFSP